MKDSQRKKLYTAERVAFKDFPGMADVSTPARYERRVRDIMESKWVADNFANPRYTQELRVEFSPRMGGANAGAARIRTGLNAHAMQEWYLIHELSHALHHRLPSRKQWDMTGHGRQYAEIYLRVVKRFMGVAAYTALRSAFRANKVKVGAKRVRVISAEQKAKLVENLASARAAKQQAKVAMAAKLRAEWESHDAALLSELLGV